MNSNDSKASSFGRLNWNISKEFSYKLADGTVWINNVGVCFEITAIIFFLCKFCQQKSQFRTPFFVIYSIGCISDAIPKCNSLGYLYINQQFFMYFSYSVSWYQGNFNSMWNLILALNRFTAIVFYANYNRFWTKRNTTTICIFLLLYPFLIGLYKPLMLWCNMTGYFCPTSIRLSFRVTAFDNLILLFLDFIYAFMAVLFCSIASICQSKRNKSTAVKIQRFEIILLIQSLLSSICLALSATVALLASVNGPEENATKTPETLRAMNLQLFLSCIREIFYAFYHYSGLILMFVLSTAFRKEYLKFYKLNYLLRFRIFIKPESTTITVISTTSKTTNGTRFATTNIK